MCTVSIIPLADHAATGGCRIVCNRDEQRSRPAALPPQRRRFGNHEAILPIDPESDGTWVAATDGGLVLTLLNVNDPDAPREPDGASRTSRGRVIPSLLGVSSVDETFRAALAIDASMYDPFRLLIVSPGGCIEVVSDGRRVRCGRAMLGDSPAVFSSSGLGDGMVVAPRRALFDELCDRAPTLDAAQEAFHKHRWSNRTHLSVMMSRADARTVSRTAIDLFPDHASMRYEAIDDDGRIAGLSSEVVMIRQTIETA